MNNIFSPEIEEKFKKHFSRYYRGYCLSKAILQDYAQLVAKIEGIDENQVKERIQKRAIEIAKEDTKELN